MKTEGNAPLTDNLKQKVHRSAILIVLLTNRYLQSKWCESELNWFKQTVERKTIALKHPVFVVQLHDIERSNWPEILRDLPGYNFVGDGQLNLPKGYRGEEKPRGDEYFDAARKTAGDIVKHIKILKAQESALKPSKGIATENNKPTVTSITVLPRTKQALYLAAVPEESAGLRRRLVTLLRGKFDIVPLENPIDPLVVRAGANSWARQANSFRADYRHFLRCLARWSTIPRVCRLSESDRGDAAVADPFLSIAKD